MKHVFLLGLLVLAGCASNGTPPPATTTAADPTFRSLTEAQAYYDRLEQQQKKLLANFPSIRREPCPLEPGLVPGTPQL
jgi:hypothetical protein